MLYRTLVALIKKNRINGLAEKIDIFYAAGKLTDEQYSELSDMLSAKLLEQVYKMDITNYIMPELLLIVPVLWVIGKLLKEADFIRDKLIPLILGGVGILLSVCWVVGAANHISVTVVFTAVTQGILCAGAAVYGNQIFKQLRKKENGSKEKKDGD